ncbi:MAG: WD40 repeat domain-containing protein [Methanocalculus sp.]|uniref:WD40 repeat domain-containing protein n=1 Tax=Methanocalculus sp. TaxID=2004547 RepID=UPI0027217D06|nr:WD40 repeat domain-containing protein [Methanocalculus sp.]MDO9539814.1 WD40 repeat domain-containing protein [Methanocalculus sp.]
MPDGTGHPAISKKPLWNYTGWNQIRSLAMSADGNYIVAGQQIGSVDLFYRNGTRLWEFDADNGWVDSVAISTDGQYISAGADSKRVYYLDRNGTLLWKYNTHSTHNYITVSADGQYIAVEASGGGPFTGVYFFYKNGTLLWNYTPADNRKIPNASNNDWVRCAMSSDSQYIVVGSSYPTLVLLSRNGTTLWKYYTHDAVIPTISTNGQDIFAFEPTSGAYHFGMNGTLLWEKSLPRTRVQTSADGQNIVMGDGRFDSEESNVYYYDLNGTLLWRYPIQRSISALVISTDGRYIVAGTEGGVIYYFRKDGTLIWNYPARSRINAVAVSEDGKYVTAGTDSKKVYFFDS